MPLLIDNDTSHPLREELLQTIVSDLTPRDVELLVVDDETMQEINATHRGKNEPTDVLSFPLEQNVPHIPLGSIIISYETAERISLEMGHDINDEMALLFIHGMLHLLGFDHECDTGEMRDKERELLAHYGLPSGLIARSDSLR